MWLCTPYGFFSIVRAHAPGTAATDWQPKPHPTLMMVRARKHGHLAELKRRHGLPGKVVTNKGTDYPYRLLVDRAVVRAMVAEVADAIDYTNFKDAAKVQSPGDTTLHTFLMGVWNLGHKLTPTRVRRKLWGGYTRYTDTGGNRYTPTT